MFEVTVPATSANLGSGFDCLGLAVALYNRVEVSSAAHLRISVQGEGAGELPEDADNLLWRSACHLFDLLGRPREPVSIVMRNSIPLSRGLGSSSAAIVAGLMLANHLTGEQFDRSQLLSMATALEGHPDNVAPAIFGGLTVSVQVESQTHVLPFPFPEVLQLMVCVPEFPLATSLARRALPNTVSHRDAAFNLSRVALLLTALLEQRFDLLSTATDDRLHQPYRLGLIPGAATALREARRAGAAAAMISGAGPTLLALVPPEIAAMRVGERMVAGFAAEGISARQLLLQLDRQGALVAP